MSTPVFDAQTVFRMRKAGQLPEALAAARKLYTKQPKNIWNARALAWCLLSTAWAALLARNREVAAGVARELEPLVDGKDEQLQAAARKLNQALAGNRGNDIVAGLKALSGQLAGLPEGHPPNPAWAGEARDLLARYARLPGPRQASLTHSIVLFYAICLSSLLPRFLDFVRWWNPSMLRPEDFQGYLKPGAERPLPSLAERLAKALHQTWQAEPGGREHLAWIEQVLSDLRQRQPSAPWIPYYHAMALSGLGRHADARNLFLPFATRHARDHWVWGALATMSPDQAGLAASCYVRALACGASDPALLLGHRAGLAGLWIQAGHLGAAKVEVEAGLATRRAHNWKNNELWNRLEGSTRDLPADQQAHRQLCTESEALLTQLLFKPDTPAVVTHVNHEKGIAAFATGPRQEALALFRAVPGAARLHPGDTVLLHAQPGPDGKPARVAALMVTPGQPPPAFCRIFRGPLKRHPDGFGFVDDIFVPPALMAQLGAARHASGIAAPAPRPNGKDPGWRAITCKPEETPCPA